MIAALGAVIAQLFTLEEKDAGFGYSLVGKPLAILCYFISMATVLIGAFRTWRYQQAMVHGKALSGGIEISAIAFLFLAVSTSSYLHVVYSRSLLCSWTNLTICRGYSCWEYSLAFLLP